MNGQPLLTWPIQAALTSGVFDLVIVSTDDPEIAEIATAAGAEVPFHRPGELADDWTPTAPVIAHAIQSLADAGRSFDLACCLYPAAIFISGSDIRESRDLLLANGSADHVVTVAEYPMPIELALNLGDERVLTLNTPEWYGTRTQDLPARYHDVGQLYWGRSPSWLAGGHLLHGALGYPLPKWRSQDIDTEDDWIRAQFMHSMWLRDTREAGRSA
jgi:pseudaminic acid cytidylyltransferase